MHKAYLKDKIILLRQQGYSYELIKDKTGVSKSTLSGWLKSIPYEHNKEVKDRMKKGLVKSSVTLRRLRLNRISNFQSLAKSELGKLSKRDLMLVGIGLYIGEGSKYDRGFMQFSNSDPKVIRLAMSWFVQILKINIKNFYLIIHGYPDTNVKSSIKFWSNITGVSSNQFGKTYIDIRKNKSIKNKRKTPNGTLHIRIRGLSEKFAREGVYQKILAWIDLVESYNFAGIV